MRAHLGARATAGASTHLACTHASTHAFLSTVAGPYALNCLRAAHGAHAVHAAWPWWWWHWHGMRRPNSSTMSAKSVAACATHAPGTPAPWLRANQAHPKPVLDPPITRTSQLYCRSHHPLPTRPHRRASTAAARSPGARAPERAQHVPVRRRHERVQRHAGQQRPHGAAHHPGGLRALKRHCRRRGCVRARARVRARAWSWRQRPFAARARARGSGAAVG